MEPLPQLKHKSKEKSQGQKQPSRSYAVGGGGERSSPSWHEIHPIIRPKSAPDPHLPQRPHQVTPSPVSLCPPSPSDPRYSNRENYLNPSCDQDIAAEPDKLVSPTKVS